MKNYLVLIFLLFICIDSFPQREKVKTYYSKGKLKSQGTMYSFANFDKRIPKEYEYFKDLKKKDGEWKYWYENGNLSRIENYKADLNISSLSELLNNLKDVPDGKWLYYNEEGIQYREDIYKDGRLFYSEKDIYKDNRRIGSFTFNNGVTDTTFTEPIILGKNQIINPEFDMFYYKPVMLISHGKSKIDEMIPFWRAPGNYTPDYLSNLRFVDVLSKYYLFDFELPEKFSYAGFALYKESELYSEYIQGKLIEPLKTGHLYCLRISVAVPSYSGFSVDRLAFHLSSGTISVNEENESSLLPQVVLSMAGVDNTRFVTLCDYFVAEGGEQFITLGRFSSPDKMEIKRRRLVLPSQFGIDKSAYCLLDNIDLHEISVPSECSCLNEPIRPVRVKTITRIDTIRPEIDFPRLKAGTPVVLKNVNFKFNSYILTASADTVLNKLLTFLYQNPSVRIHISGHTDDVGSEVYNLELSVNRAKAVYNWLVNNGIEPIRLTYAGYGKSQPLFRETGEQYRLQNRRVEVQVIK